VFRINPRIAALSLVCLGAAVAQGGDAIAPGGRAFFETKIRPTLVKQCYECHSAKSEKLGGKLLLDSRAGVLKGGESGPALVAGHPEQSLIIQSLRWEHDLEMPPDEPLNESVVADFVRWIEMGAPDPRAGDAKAVAGKDYQPGDLWALEPVKDPALPQVAASDWPRGPIDRFALAQMEGLGMKPTKDARPESLIRRLSYDLIGLPPSLVEVESFVADFKKQGQGAVARLVDDLLASPHFGERWGRHWLDVARYGESNGNDGLSRNPAFPHAWRYRDYVISAFNEDLPYDRFLTEQIAGDLLPADSDAQRDRYLIATGFLALGAKPAKAMNNNFAMDIVADQLDVIGSGVMGLGVACARCHDHKFDPIPTRDYYALAGIFTSTETMYGVAGNEKLTAPPTDLHTLKAAPNVKPPAGFVETVLVRESATGKLKPIPKSKWAPGAPVAMGVRDGKKPADGKINLKGDAKKLGEVVPRGFLSACDSVTGIKVDPKQSGRLQLAQWLTSPDHPTAARVMANRVWLHLFGRGIVHTPNDFGVYGERPTHPELLDCLAAKFVAEGWSVKQLIRTIVLSRTYQLDSRADVRTIDADPENLWLTRHSRRRLDAESLRDSMLQVAGQLNPSAARGSLIRHRPILVNLGGNLHQPSNHRSVYLCYLRSSPPPELAAFDLPDFQKSMGRRESSVASGNALYLFNNPFVLKQAERFAASLFEECGSDESARASAAIRRAFHREPRTDEVARAVQLTKATEAEVGCEKKALASLCQALLAASEFRYID